MRAVILALVVIVSSSPSAVAQESRVSFELSTGPTATSPLFDHVATYPPSDPAGYSVQDHVRLSIGGMTTVSGRVNYRVDEKWTVLAELGRGSTDYLLRASRVVLVGGASSQFEKRGAAKRASFRLGVQRRSSLAAFPVDLEPQLSVSVQRLQVGDPSALCLPSGPISSSPCPRYERTYVVPGVGAGLAAVYAIGLRLAVVARGEYAIGVASTKDAFYEDLPPEYDSAEAPKWQSVRTAHVSAGLRFTP
jgi:hypothetical protein